MRSPRPFFLCGLLYCLFALTLQAEVDTTTSAPDPLRLVPSTADLVIQVPKPKSLIDVYSNLEVVKQLYTFREVRELYDSTNARRFYQLVAYFEKQLGVKWPEALERLAGGGITVVVKFGPDPAPALFILQATDEKLLEQFVKVGLDVVEQELARQESKEKVERGKYRDMPTFKLGKDFHAGIAGNALVISNKAEVLQASLDLRGAEVGKSLAGLAALTDARKLLPANPLAWLWVNLETLHKAPQAKEVFAQPRNDQNLTILAGGLLDVARRAPYVCAAITQESDGFLTTVRLPAGREGMPAELAVHVPLEKAQGVLPLLEPKGVLYSSSYHFDIAKFWEHRAKLFNEKQVKEFEKFDQQSAAFLLGNRFSKLVSQVGPRQRLVVANQPQPPGSIKAEDKGDPVEARAPAFAFVLEMREPEAFAKSMSTILRGAALLAGTQIKMKLFEEKHGEHTLVGYRFEEGDKPRPEIRFIRNNFTPCFVRVGNQFVMASTIELGRELADLVEKEAKAGPAAAAEKPADAKADLDKLEQRVEALIKELADPKTKKKGRSKMIADLAKTDKERIKLAKQVKDQAKAPPAQPAPANDGNLAGRSRLYSGGGVDILRQNEDQLLAQTILNQAISPDEAKKQVEAFIALVRKLGVLQFETSYGAKQYEFSVRLRMNK